MSRLSEKLAAGRLVVTSELPVVDGGGLEAVRTRLDGVAEWVDAINATDNTAAHAHASNVAVAIALLHFGVEPIMQIVCRDKNRLAIQADLAGAALHGVENVCCLTGDDVTAGDEPEARRVFDLDGPQLIAVARTIASGRYLSGRPLEPAPPLFVGAVENPGAPPYDYRVERAVKKAEAGAQFLQLQVSYEPERLEAFAAGVAGRVPLLPSICLVGGVRALRFMDAEVPGISVPAATIARIEAASDPGEACLDLAVEQARHALAQPGVAGLHVISFRRDRGIERLCGRLDIPPREEREASGYRRPVAV